MFPDYLKEVYPLYILSASSMDCVATLIVSYAYLMFMLRSIPDHTLTAPAMCG